MLDALSARLMMEARIARRGLSGRDHIPPRDRRLLRR